MRFFELWRCRECGKWSHLHRLRAFLYPPPPIPWVPVKLDVTIQPDPALYGNGVIYNQKGT